MDCLELKIRFNFFVTFDIRYFQLNIFSFRIPKNHKFVVKMFQFIRKLPSNFNILFLKLPFLRRPFQMTD
jgi:hypothetical protein